MTNLKNSTVSIRNPISIAAYVIGLLYLSSCTLNPTATGYVNGEYSYDITFDIVEKVHCETRDAMAALAIKLIELEYKGHKNRDIPIFTVNGLKQTVDMLKRNPGSVKYLRQWDVPFVSQVLASILINSQVQYGFDITVNETNTNSFSPKFTASHGIHKLNLGIAGQSFASDRKNQRSFIIPATQFDIFQYLDCPRDYPFITTYGKKDFPGIGSISGSFSKRQNDRLASVKTNEQKILVKNAGVNAKKAQRPDVVYPLRGNIALYKTLDAFANYTHIGTYFEERRLLAIKAFHEATSQMLPIIKGAKILKTFRKQDPYNQTLQAYDFLKGCSEDQLANDHRCRKAAACISLIHQRAGLIYSKKLNDLPGTPKTGEDEGAFKEILTFMTTIESGLSPTVTFATPASLSLETIGFSLIPKRIDTHTLTSTFVVNPVDELPPLYSKKKSVVVPVSLAKKDGYEIIVNLPKTIKEPADNTCNGLDAKKIKLISSNAFAVIPLSAAAKQKTKKIFVKENSKTEAELRARVAAQ